ncbi:MAG: apolipoprotein N-acyltransferase [Halothiobacillus sp. 24-54-40]|nr:MAG: apolipoprotein N-acyltransferase [Halothiobacillus sp. 35-54-62]OYZ87662.1 MAG: apolipoprotein N-acyltransferase [Halothiobacillus sp. 24-54-40]OZA81155.1 MAG: apolipoprotein N-acyltransferase [Halothiobacillus sp. 39-53-45]HQS03024.1 apolipoprotein N-acyltransferase [Halothiobacillus sp.]HQS29560.1 apolipoprotein N-acyltransferase [Halothiobacillus sp.]
MTLISPSKTLSKNPAPVPATVPRLSPRWRLLLALLAGAALPLAFAPVGFWPLSLLSPAVLLLLLQGSTPRRAFVLGWLFGLGQFGVGVSWLYESFTLFGGAVAPLAAFITFIFAALVAVYLGLTAWLATWVSGGNAAAGSALGGRQIAAFTGSWVFFEWLRGWVFSGFPWLDLGIAQTASPLGGFLPVVGEYGTSFIVVGLAGALAWFAERMRQSPQKLGPSAFVLTGALVFFLGLGSLLGRVAWTHPTASPLSVGIAQANVPQMQKFDPAFLNKTLQTYVALTEQMGPVSLVIWPETAIPDVLSDLDGFKQILDDRAKTHQQDFLVGAFTQDAQGRYYNTLVGVPESVGQHRKAHLVPFSEYMPLRPIVDLFAGLIDIPMSDLSPGAPNQPLPQVQGIKVGASICYEADFARDIRMSLPAAGFLVNVSNDSWFGDSFAPHQNLQMAQVRALEFGRPMARATNTGISAFIDAQGRIVQKLGVNQQGVLVGSIQPYQGSTPFYWLQSWPIIFLSGLLLAGVMGFRLKARRIID